MASFFKRFWQTQWRRNWFLHCKIVATFGSVATLGRLIDIHGRDASFDSNDIERFIMLETNPSLLKKEVPIDSFYRQLLNCMYFPFKYSMDDKKLSTNHINDDVYETYNEMKNENEIHVIKRDESIDCLTNELLKLRIQRRSQPKIYYITGKQGIGKSTLFEESIINVKQILSEQNSTTACIVNLKLELPNDIDQEMLINSFVFVVAFMFGSFVLFCFGMKSNQHTQNLGHLLKHYIDNFVDYKKTYKNQNFLEISGLFFVWRY